MAWPQSTDYNAAVQNPADAFTDPDLRAGQVVCNELGLPQPHAGSFADVYQIAGPKQNWAVKCFTRAVPNRRQRFQAISDHLKQLRRAFLVDFSYHEQGICVFGDWFPILKMRWVEGPTLNEYVREQVDKPAVLERLAQLWLRLAQELRESNMAHGDLQHGNVLLVPGRTAGSLALRLVDYDGIFVPALAKRPAVEVGHGNYQHPDRYREGGYDLDVDRFPHLVIYTAFRALAVAGRALWEAFDNSENLLFREADFIEPRESKLWPELLQMEDPAVRHLAGHLLQACRRPRAETPLLEHIAPDGDVRPFNIGEQAAVRSWMGMSGANPWLWQPPPPPLRPRLLPVGPVTLNPGKRQPLTVKINRQRFQGRLQLRCEGLPDLIKAESEPIHEEEEEGVVLLKPAPNADAPPGPVILSLWSGDTQLDESRFEVNVAAPSLPRLAKLAPVRLHAGEDRRLAIPIQRNGWKDDVALRVEGLPDGVTSPGARPATAFITLRLKARPGTKPGTAAAKLSLWAGNHQVDDQRLIIIVQPAQPASAPAPDAGE